MDNSTIYFVFDTWPINTIRFNETFHSTIAVSKYSKHLILLRVCRFLFELNERKIVNTVQCKSNIPAIGMCEIMVLSSKRKSVFWKTDGFETIASESNGIASYFYKVLVHHLQDASSFRYLSIPCRDVMSI